MYFQSNRHPPLKLLHSLETVPLCFRRLAVELCIFDDHFVMESSFRWGTFLGNPFYNGRGWFLLISWPKSDQNSRSQTILLWCNVKKNGFEGLNNEKLQHKHVFCTVWGLQKEAQIGILNIIIETYFWIRSSKDFWRGLRGFERGFSSWNGETTHSSLHGNLNHPQLWSRCNGRMMVVCKM